MIFVRVLEESHPSVACVVMSCNFECQFVELLLETGGVYIPDEVKKEVVLNLHEMSSSALVPDHLLLHLASSWRINLPEK